MTKQEFLDTLRKVLNRELSEAEVEENIRYYSDYISQQVSQGLEEAQVIAQLGDPRLIAKTILQVDESRERAGSIFYDSEESVYTENPDGSGYAGDTSSFRDGQEAHLHTFQISGWKIAAVLILVLILLCVIVGTVIAVVWRLLPVILVIGLVLWIYHRFFY